MKTTYLDNEIILLEGYKKEGTATPYQLRKLKEYLEIKQLIITSVAGQSEQLVCDYCNDDAKPTCCDSCLKGMEYKAWEDGAVTAQNDAAKEIEKNYVPRVR